MADEKTPAKRKSKAFAVRIVKLSRFLRDNYKEYALADQIMRSGTSIGANLAESECAMSEADFVTKIYIALKETVETAYWLDLLKETDLIEEALYQSLMKDCLEIKKILMATTKTVKTKNQTNK